jgi:drug/metabolite transporter (DMT)-like permease
MAAIALALGSSALWGLADFLGGVKSRRYAVPVVLGVMYATSLVVMAVVVALSGDPRPDGEGVVAALLAGLAGIAGLAAFYRALAIGTMSIVAPIASTGVALPVLVGIFGGEDPGVARGIGIAVAVVGVVLASREDDGGADDARQQRVSVLLALAAGIGFGSYFVGAEIASRDSVAWALLLTRVAATPLVLAAAVVALRRGRRRPRGRELAALAGIGLLDLGANALYNQATTMGELSVVAVASSLYPVMTVLLAAAVLGERVRGVQRLGVAVAVLGVLMIAGGA